MSRLLERLALEANLRRRRVTIGKSFATGI
jgi:hypothetical protein